MAKGCNRACPYNTLYGCKAEEYNATCPMKPKTNADRIRAMSDEELATLLSELCWSGDDCYSCPLHGKSCGNTNGLSGWLGWAKQPAEVDNG